MSKPASLLAESDAALAALAMVDDAHAPASARAAADVLGRLALAFEELGQAGASLLLDEMAALCRGAAAASGEHRAALVAAVREAFATLCATGLATRAAVESTPTVNRLRALRAASPVRLATLLPGSAPDDDALLPEAFAQRARQWRTWFQKGLTGWLRGQPEAMELLRTVVSRVAELATGSAAHATWRAAVLFTDALPATPGAAAATDRQRLMRLDAGLRALAEHPAGAFGADDATLTEELLGAVLGLRPHALAPRGAARSALLRRLCADLALFRTDLAGAAGVTRRTVPAAVRAAADTLALLEATAPRRRLLAVGERLRAHAEVEAVVGELSQIIFTLESEARLAAGEPALGAPPVLARELSALAEVLAETPPASPAPAPSTAAAPASGTLRATVADLEEGRDRIDSAVAAARRRLLDAEDALTALRESVLRLELAGDGAAAADELGALRAHGTALATRFGAAQEMLRELQVPLASQARAALRLRRLLDDATLASLAPMLESHLARGAAAAGLQVGFVMHASGEPLHLPAEPLGEALLALVDALLALAAGATPADDGLTLAVTESRRGAALFIVVALQGVDPGTAEPATGGEPARLARRLGGCLQCATDARGWSCWLRLPDADAMRRLLRVEAGGETHAVPVADVAGVGRETGLPDAARVHDLGVLLNGRPCASAGPVLEVAGEDAPCWFRVDAAEELAAGTPLALAAPLDGIGWLAGAALTGDGRVLAVLDLPEVALAAATPETAGG